jgi:XTP/dITP diphosphohydrolase
MAETLLIGSGNRKKAEELAHLLEGLPWEVKSLRDFPSVPEPEETGLTFEENALLKAEYYSKAFGVA